MKAAALLLAAIALMAFAKPKRKQFRIRVQPRNGYTMYIPEYREKRSLFGAQWWPIAPNVYYDLASAKQVVEDAKFEDSLAVAHVKDTFIYFNP